MFVNLTEQAIHERKRGVSIYEDFGMRLLESCSPPEQRVINGAYAAFEKNKQGLTFTQWLYVQHQESLEQEKLRAKERYERAALGLLDVHTSTCSFVGCNCGKYKAARAEATEAAMRLSGV